MMYKNFLLSISIILIATTYQAQGKDIGKTNNQKSNKDRNSKFASKPILKATNEFEWKQGQSPTRLGIKGNQGVCFLTRVVGRFEGYVEQVHVYIDGADGEWKLGGSSAKIDVGGNARCIVTSVTYQ